MQPILVSGTTRPTATGVGAREPLRLASRPASPARRRIQLLAGLFLYGIAIATMMQATIGIEPWDVLAQGITVRTGIPFGLVTNLVGAVVLLFWIPLRQRPGIGTLLNVLLVGPSAQFGLWAIPQPDQLWARILLFAAGLLLIAAASGLYIGAHYGPGPRDGLMTGLTARTGRPIWLVRTGIEAVVLLVGWLLGGNVGWGTLAYALCIGPLVHVAIPLFALRLPDAAPAADEDARLIEPDSLSRRREPAHERWALSPRN
jgi:uncharacterized membrane protein YczE